ncbi:MAG: DUF1499 domain-containing protein [Alteripontixanthobacter sp.]
MNAKSWATRIGWMALFAAIVGAGLMFAGATRVRFAGDADKLAGFSWVPLGMMIAAGALLLALVALIWRFAGKRGSARSGVLALIVAGIPLGWVVAQIVSAGDAPAIHDVTTDLGDPPAFAALPLAEDNLRGVETEEKWRELHARAYADIEPLVVGAPVDQVIAEAASLARDKGWNVASSNAASGAMEATATVSYYRFKDDVVLRVSDMGNGRSRVDMRSVSRVGISDLGYNAARIREFLADLDARLEG